MTDRIFALTVLLDQDIRADDVEPIIKAIEMVRHVQKVETHVSDLTNWSAEMRAKVALEKKLWEALS